MTTKIIDGFKIANNIKKKIKKLINIRKQKKKRAPGLATIIIGNDPASLIYIQKKKEACHAVGFFSKCIHIPYKTSEYNLIKIIKKLNYDKKIDGILVQLPLPKEINQINVLKTIHPKKDVDGFHPYNIGLLFQNFPIFKPCTPKGIITLLKSYKIKITGLYAVIIGDSNIVGKPMFLELLREGCTATITNKFTKNLKYHVKNADLIIIAVGQPNFLFGNWVKKGAIVIDVGINYLMNNKKIVGDVHFPSVSKKTSYITPVPGGVGPMTVISLIQNTLKSYEKIKK